MAKKTYEEYLKELQEKTKNMQYTPSVYSDSSSKKANSTISAKNVNSIEDVYNFAQNNTKSYSQQLEDYKNSLKQTSNDSKALTKAAQKYDLDLTGTRYETPTLSSVQNRDVLAPSYSRHNANSALQTPIEKLINSKNELNRQTAAYNENIKDSEELKDYNERKDKVNAVLEYSKNVAKNREDTSNKGKYTSAFLSGAENVLIPFKNHFKTEDGDQVSLPTYNQIRASQFRENSDSGIYKAYSDVTQSIGNMLPGIAAGAVSAGLGSAAFFANTYTTARNQALLDGYDNNSASTYALVNANLELGVGKVLGGASAIMGKSPVAKEIGEKFTSKFMSNPVIASVTADMISEFGEEYVQEWLDPKVQSYILDHKDIVESWQSSKFLSKENFYAGLLGAVSAGIMNTPNAIKMQSNLNNQVNSIINSVENEYNSKLTDAQKKSIKDSFYTEYNRALKENDNINYQNVVDNDTIVPTNTREERNLLPGLDEKTTEEEINNVDTKQNIQTEQENNINENNISNVYQEEQSTDTNLNETNLNKEIDKLTNRIEELESDLKNNKYSFQERIDIKKEINNLENQKIAYENGYNNYDEMITAKNNRANYYNLPMTKTTNIADNNIEEINNNTTTTDSLKQKQLDIINQSNPSPDIVHTWIRNANDIKTFSEAFFEDNEYSGLDPDFTKDMATEALETGKITVYSSYPIENGVFVSPSKLEASQYAGGDYNKVYSKEVSIDDVAWIDGAEGQYASVDDINLPNQSKGNIPINNDLLNKYSNVNEIFNNEKINYDGVVNVKSLDLDLENKNATEIYHTAIEIFKQNHKKNNFINDGNVIYVTNSDIKESVNKIYNDRLQNKYLKEHLEVFSDLGDIIENSKLVNQTIENKNRPNYNTWNYYYNGLNIDGELFNLEFDVVSRNDGQNHYRLQRLKKADAQSALPLKGEADLGASASYTDNITNLPKSQNAVLPINNDIQNNKNNTLDPIEISKLKSEDANTTPNMPNVSRNKTNDGNSKFWSNIAEKTDMLSEEQKQPILSENEVKYYDKITNKESLENAYEKLNKNGKNETLNWFNKESTSANATDVAEGWILLKQYADNNDTDGMVAVAKKMRDIGTKAGQTVQAFNIMERMTPEGMVAYAQSELLEAYDKMVKNKSKEWIEENRGKFELTQDEVQFIMDNMQEISTMEDGYDKRVKLAEIQKVMTDKLPATKGSEIKSWMRISMLFNPKTQVRNVVGNALIAPVNYFGDVFSSYADKVVSKKTGVRTTGNMNVKAILDGMKKGAYEATNDYKKGINTKDMEGNRFEIGEGKAFNEKTIIGKSLNMVDGLLNYMMDAGDRVFSESSFENSLKNQMVLNHTSEVTQEMIDIARTESLQRTWNDNNNYTKFVLDVRRMMNKLNVNGYGLGDVLIPFAKTPANLTKAIVDYSPVGLVNTIIDGNNLRKSLTNGQYTAQMQHKFVQDLGKATAGTMLYVLGYALAKSGVISGESDDDKDTRNFLKNTLGISSYSIKIGDKTFTYDWAQPLAAPLSIMANIEKSKENKEQALLEGIVSSLDSAGSILLDQSFLTSINDVLSDNDGVVSGLINEVLELPARAVPTFSKQIADLVDGTQRQTYEYGNPLKSAVNNIKAKIPGLSKTLAPSVDTMGREVQKYGGKNNIFNVFLNPANVNTENISEGAEEIYRLYKSVGDNSIMPRVAPYYVNSNGEKITLNSQQVADYQKVSGNIIEESMKRIVSDTSYQKMSDTEKANVVKQIIDYSYNKAKQEVLGIGMASQYNKVNQYVENGGNVENYYLNKDEINYSIQYPEKYNTITQITTYDKYTEYKEEITNIRDNTDNDKEETIKYINSLSLSIPQKAMFIKQYYPSFKEYDEQIIKYIDSQKITITEKQEILEELGFKIKDGKVYSK